MRLIKDSNIKDRVKTNLDGRPLAFERLIKMNWLRVNFNLFEINKILMLAYYGREVVG